METETYRITLYLAGGREVVTEVEFPGELDEEEVVAIVHKKLSQGDGYTERPGWRTIENLVVYSQAVSAVQVEQLTHHYS